MSLKIVKAVDLAFNGRTPTSSETDRMRVQVDIAMGQVLSFLESDPAYVKHIANMVENEKKSQLEAAQARRDAIAAKERAKIESELAEKKARIEQAQAEMKALEAEKVSLGKAPAPAPVAPAPVAEKKNDPVDTNGDGKVDKSERLAKLKTKVTPEEFTKLKDAHWKTVEAEYNRYFK